MNRLFQTNQDILGRAFSTLTPNAGMHSDSLRTGEGITAQLDSLIETNPSQWALFYMEKESSGILAIKSLRLLSC